MLNMFLCRQTHSLLGREQEAYFGCLLWSDLKRHVNTPASVWGSPSSSSRQPLLSPSHWDARKWLPIAALGLPSWPCALSRGLRGVAGMRGGNQASFDLFFCADLSVTLMGAPGTL